MKLLFHKIASSVMALLLLLSTVSWTVDKHLCMGRVMDVSLFTKAKDCGMTDAMALLEDETRENHCCDDESFTMQGQEDLKPSFNDFSITQQQFVIALTDYYSALFVVSKPRSFLSKKHPPPLLIKDIQLLDEVFLI